MRPYPGLTQTIARLRELLAGSSLWEAVPRNLQDPLTFRTAAQVLGAARDALAYARDVLAVELNAHQGNPVVAAAEGRILPVGNFDVVPLAAALDFLRIALAPALTSAAERALKLLQAPLTGLPEGLAARPGLAEPALSELGHAVQGIVAEARLLAQPVSFELASTTQHEGIEDRTTMAPLAARRLAEMVELGARVVAIELTIAAQAVDLRRPREARRRVRTRARARPGTRSLHGRRGDAAAGPRARRRARPLGRPALGLYAILTSWKASSSDSTAASCSVRRATCSSSSAAATSRAAPTCRRSCSTSRTPSASCTASSCGPARK